MNWPNNEILLGLLSLTFGNALNVKIFYFVSIFLIKMIFSSQLNKKVVKNVIAI